MNRLKREINNENGAIAIIILVLFVVILISLFAIYRFVVGDYITTTSSIEAKGDKLQQTNVIESIKSNYIQDMKNDILYDDMVVKLKEDAIKMNKDPEEMNSWKLDYLNYKYSYNNLDEQGSEISLGSFGRFYWEPFTNYKEILPKEPIVPGAKYIRIYDVSANWKDDTIISFKNGAIRPPSITYLEVVFDSGVNSLDISFDGKGYNLINRGGTTIVKLEELPSSIGEISIESTEPLGGTSFSFLKAREIDIEVFNKDNLGRSKGEKVLVKTLRMELGLNKNVMKFLEIGSEVE